MEGQPTFPVGATDYLVEHGFDGRVMTPFVEGAYAMWRLHPQGARISFDGRFEAAYPPDVQLAHRVFYAASGGWADVLRAYPTDVILVPRDQPILTPLLSSPGWRVVYGDDLYVLVAREEIALPFTDRRGRTFVGRLP